MSTKFRSGGKTALVPSNTLDNEPTGAHNFQQRAAAYVATHGGRWHVIRSDRAGDKGHATPAAWLAWMEWFFRHSIPMRFARQHGIVTVPSEWPERGG